MYLVQFFTINLVSQALVTFQFLTRQPSTNNPAYVLGFSIRYLYCSYTCLLSSGVWADIPVDAYDSSDRNRRGIEHTITWKTLRVSVLSYIQLMRTLGAIQEQPGCDRYIKKRKQCKVEASHQRLSPKHPESTFQETLIHSQYLIPDPRLRSMVVIYCFLYMFNLSKLDCAVYLFECCEILVRCMHGCGLRSFSHEQARAKILLYTSLLALTEPKYHL